MTYLVYQERLEEIERDLAEKQPHYEAAAEEAIRLAREFELRMAKTKLASSATTETAKKDQALVAIAASDDELWEHHKNAEGLYAGYKAAVKVLETRAMIGMSLLRAQQREIGG